MFFVYGICLAILYAFIGLIVHRAMYKLTPFSHDDCTAIAVFWPISLLLLAIFSVSIKVSDKIIVYIDRYIDRFGKNK